MARFDLETPVRGGFTHSALATRLKLFRASHTVPGSSLSRIQGVPSGEIKDT